MKPSILVLNEYSNVGGAEKVLLQIIAALRMEYDFHIILSNEGRLSNEFKGMGISVTYFDFHAMKKSWFRPSLIKSYRKIFKSIISEFEPDVILANSIWCACALKILNTSITSKIVCAVHADINPKRFGKKAFFRIFRKLMIEHVDIWVTVSEELKDMIKKIKSPNSSVEVICNGIDLKAFEIFNRSKKSGNEIISIGTVGRLHPGKGQQDIILAAAKLNQHHRYLRIIVIGEEFTNVNEEINFTHSLVQLSKEKNIEDIVSFAGFTDDLLRYYREMDIFVLMSREESFGLSVLEAMAAGLPVIAGNVGGLRELICDGINGFLIQPGDINGLAEKLDCLIRDKQLRLNLGREGRRIAGKFNIDSMIDSWKQVLEEAMCSE